MSAAALALVCARLRNAVEVGSLPFVGAVPVVEVNGVGGVDEVFEQVRGAIKRVTGGI